MMKNNNYHKPIIVLTIFVILMIVLSSRSNLNNIQVKNQKVHLYDHKEIERLENAINKKEFELEKKRFAIEKLKFGIEKKKKENEYLDMTNEKEKKQSEETKQDIKELENEISAIEKEKKVREEEIDKEKKYYRMIKDIVTDKGKIDLVYSWAGIVKTMNNRNRYNYELQFSLRAAHKYLPWLNKIYILINSDTDYPYWINEENSGKIIVYDRCQLIDNPKHCPTFNTFAVFAGLHKIEGLSKRFILIDDDVFINQLLTPDYFFTKNDLPRVYQKHKRMQIYKNNSEFQNIKRPDYKFAKYSHLPKPMRRDFIVKFQEEYKEYAELVQSHKTRYQIVSEEFSMIYYEYFFERGWLLAEPKRKGKFYQIPFDHEADITKEFNKVYKDLTTKNIKTFNCNDDFSKQKAIYYKQKKVLWNFFNKLYPEAPDYEYPNPEHENFS
ncbi:hypothetical protein M0812_25128 [Anaeramoeba flamelloides]|uniref:Stealth protein CR2 conserved region 2 domain-containing protein n=1 Tax=Anaeramoeba flamelloides TaxID=1746091 RepID=A0AAV7YQ29_9EUKA|nr:hypothetical protein M0812_25128 [Anaeramoeba flamelloides]